ncbi:hypothetical protein [Alkalimonas amylolytica]|uniref:hypothetical protein n=1 Tax=Alkalimonas amylolytica TaxID=152573 RepID=UPI000B822F57|nr:hypothetical protein [Alkalimonas amylolytica]
MRIVLLILLLCTLLSGCNKPGTESHDPKQYSLLNDQLVYNAKFAEIFSLDRPTPLSWIPVF